MGINDEILLFRKEIDEIDYNILLLLNRRVEISKNVGVIKMKKGISIRDYRREDEVYLRVMQKACLVTPPSSAKPLALSWSCTSGRRP